MPSCKSLSAALCLLYLTLPLVAQTPGGGRLIRDNNDPSRDEREKMTIPDVIGGKTSDEWKKDLSHADPAARGSAIIALLGFGPKALEAVPSLISIVKHDKEDAGVKSKALVALKYLSRGISGADSDKVIKTLGYTISNDRNSVIRFEAVQTLLALMADEKTAKAASAITSDLVKGMRDTSTYEMRQACIMALIACADREKGPDRNVIDELILRSKPYYEPSKQVRMEAIIALGALGRPHDPKELAKVQGALMDHYRSTDKPIRIWARVSLMALKDEINEADMKMVVDALGDSDREVRKQAVSALGAMGPKVAERVKNICDLLDKEKETMVQAAACRALARMGDKSDRVLETLIRLTESDKQKTNEVVAAACAALAQLHVASPEVMTALKNVLEHKTLSDQDKETVSEYIKIIQRPLAKDAKLPRVKDGAGDKGKRRDGR